MDILYDNGISDINETLLVKEGLIGKSGNNSKTVLTFINDYFFEYLKNNSKILKLTDLANEPFKLMAKIKMSIIGEEKLTSRLLISKSLW